MSNRGSAMSTESARFARFAIGLNIKDVPAEVLDLAREHLLDALGIAIASSGFDFGKIALAGVRALGEGTQATAIGSGKPLPAASAALLNGILAHGLDFDDTHIGGIYHASSPALAAVLPAAQANGSTGLEALLAFVASIEMGSRLGVAGGQDFHHRGWHTTGLAGTFAAAVAAGRLYKLDETALVRALGLCGSQAAGILEISDSWLKRMHPGWAAHSALVAVALGGAGFLGPSTVFEGPRGFYATHLQRIPAGETLPSWKLGETWQAMGIALKPYPICHFIHSFVDAALELRGQFPLDQIERIECPLSKMLHPLVWEPQTQSKRPQDPYHALFSVPYAVALAFSRGRVELKHFYDEPLDSPDILALTDKVWCVDDPQSDFPRRFPGEVKVKLTNGQVFQSRKPASLGSPDKPLSRTAIIAKFTSNATRVITPNAAAELVEAVLHIETEPNLSRIMGLCSSAR